MGPDRRAGCAQKKADPGKVGFNGAGETPSGCDAKGASRLGRMGFFNLRQLLAMVMKRVRQPWCQTGSSLSAKYKNL
jgi:hypothetical protein